MAAASDSSSLEGLIELSRKQGVDVRPTLLRVITDLYVQQPAHSAEEERRYTELTLRLLDCVDPAIRSAVAAQLATYAAAPKAVLLRLAFDAIEVAEPVLKFSPSLTGADLANAAQCSPAHAAAIASRDAHTAAGTADDTEIATGGAALPPPRRGGSIGRLFLEADPPERRRILAALEHAPLGPAGPSMSISAEAIQRLESAALGRRLHVLAEEIAVCLAVSASTAERIVSDESGELVVVAFRALGVPAEMLQRILLFLSPAIAHSVERVFALANLYERIEADVARHIVLDWREARPAMTRRLHQPVYWPDAADSARAAAGVPWRESPRTTLAPTAGRSAGPLPGGRQSTTSSRK